MRAEKNLGNGSIFYASPWIFAAACALLTLIIGVFAVNNYQREKKLMGRALAQEGQAVLNLVASSARAAVRGAVMRGEVSRQSWLAAVTPVIENSAEHSGIISLYLVDAGGEILVHNDRQQLGSTVDPQTEAFLQGLGSGSLPGSRTGGAARQAGQVFQIADRFSPLGFREGMPQHFREMARGRMGRMMRERPLPPEHEANLQELAKEHYYLVAELDMTDFTQSVRKQFMGLVFLSVVLLLVGIGGILSLMTLQGYRSSQLRLRRVSAFTDVLVSSLPVGIIAIGEDGRVRTCNNSAAMMIGRPGPEVEGKSPEAVLPAGLLELLAAKSSEGAAYGREISLPGNEGSEKSLYITRLVIEAAERQHTATILLMQDLSRLRELEVELRRHERHVALGKMAAGVAHELRNPLSSIKGLALLLKARFKEDLSASETVDVLVSEVERLNRSISELLNYARPELLHRTRIDIDAVVRRAITLIGSDAEVAGVQIESRQQAGSCLIGVDQDKLTQVLLNLFINSLQAMPDGGQLSITTMAEEDAVFIVISDTGHGIDPALLEKIFDPYFTTKNDGTGLGLSLSAKIIEDHQGSITLSSKREVGTTVTIRLPVH